MRSRTESNQSNSTFYQSLVVPFEHPVTSLSISPLGTEVVLAAKRGLYILNLESPFDEPKILQHFSKWEVADVIWNPHPNRSNWIASTSNQKALIWDITSGSNNHIKCILTKHLRAVSDIHWSPFHSDILATCSYDSYVHVWDLRLRSDRPAHSFSAWQVGASQVKFNRMNEFILASSHDTDVHVWDIRKGSTPQTLLTAHATKIYGIDWSRRHECELVTCSQDQQVKLWDTKEKQCKTVISTTSPVWRARFTPFGNGIVTMPQRKDNNLYLWNLDYPSVPMHIFSGHSDTPTEFVWRYPKSSAGVDPSADFQLITWSKDMHLRMWPVNKQMVSSVGQPLAEEQELGPIPQKPIKGILRTPPADRYMAFPLEEDQLQQRRKSTSFFLDDDLVSPVHPKSPSLFLSLKEELEQLQKQFPSVSVDLSKIEQRMCAISLHTAQSEENMNAISAFLRVDIMFPQGYPSIPPIFEPAKSGMMSMATRSFISSKLAQIALIYSQKSESCLEPSLKFLLGESFSPIPVHPDANSAPSTSQASTRSDQSRNIVYDRYAGIRSSSFSDTSSSDAEQGLFGYRLKPPGERPGAVAREATNVPYPVLTGARFSMNGQLVVFYSSLPHPRLNNFSSFTFTTRNQQPILQSQKFTTQPKTYTLYDSYRSFLSSKHSKPQDGQEPFFGAKLNDRLMQYYVDDDDMDDDDLLNLSFKQKSFRNIHASSPDSVQRLQDHSRHLYPVDNILFAPTPIREFESLPRRNSDEQPNKLRSRRKSVSTVSSNLSDREWGEAVDIIGQLNRMPKRLSSPEVPSPERRASPSPLTARKQAGHLRSQSGVSTPLAQSTPARTIKQLQDVTPASVATVKPENHEKSIMIFDMQHLMPFGEATAKAFTLNGSSKESICLQNAEAAVQISRLDLAQVWRFVALLVSESFGATSRLKTMPVFRKTVQSLFQHLYGLGNSQMISLIFALLNQPMRLKPTTAKPVTRIYGLEKRERIVKRETSPEPRSPSEKHSMSDHAIRIPRVSSFGSRMGSLKSNSQGFGRSLMPTSSLASRLSSTSLQAMFAEPKLEREQSLVMVRFHIDESFERHYSTQKVAEQPESSFFTQKQDLLYQLTVKSYCDHLYSWRMYNEKAELESLCHVLREEHHGLEIRPSCPECSAPMIQNSGIYSCPRCRANRAGVKCTVCRLPVHGLSWFCEQCRHGGHVHHLKEWFQENEQCPLGCGCICN